MVTVVRWTGREARSLRVALRMSVRDFAAHTNLSASSIADMEAKAEQAQLRHATQRILDEVLSTASDEARQRFCATSDGAALLSTATGPRGTREVPVLSSARTMRATLETVLDLPTATAGSECHVYAVPADRGDTPRAFEWPVWFGVQVARLVAMIDGWLGPAAPSDALQALLHQEILMFDAIAPGEQHLVHALSRRQALVSLAALPLAFATSGDGASPAGAVGSATELFLSRCAASLTACWHLLKGSDLHIVDQLLSTYLLELGGVARRRSTHQQAAAQLASQAHRICGIVALHRNHLNVREHHCKQALRYATLASDASSRASALISLASTFFYGADPARAAAVYEHALSSAPAPTPLQQSRLQAELSVVYGQLGREQDALRSAGLADQLYPNDPEQDRSFLYAEFTRASLTLEHGLVYVALAERCPGRNYQRRAADIFAGVGRAAPGAVPDRISFEVTNHQARTAVLLNDLDAFERYMRRGIDGVVQLGSRQREKELRVAWRQAIDTWPREKRLEALGERLRPTITG